MWLKRRVRPLWRFLPTPFPTACPPRLRNGFAPRSPCCIVSCAQVAMTALLRGETWMYVLCLRLAPGRACVCMVGSLARSLDSIGCGRCFLYGDGGDGGNVTCGPHRFHG